MTWFDEFQEGFKDRYVKAVKTIALPAIHLMLITGVMLKDLD